MSWLFFALLSIIFSTTYGLVSKKLLNNAEDHDPIAFASTLFLIVAIFSTIAYIFSGIKITDFQALTNPTILLILSINVFLYSAAPSFYWRSLKHLPASEVSILYDLTSVYILIFGLILKTETFSLMRLIGGLFIIGSTVILGIQTQRKSKFNFNRYFAMIMIAVILYAFAALTDNTIISHNYFSPLFFQILNFGIPAFLILTLNSASLPHLKKLYKPPTFKFIVLNGLFFFGSFWAIFQAYAHGGVTSEVNFALSSETVLTVILATILLKEREHIKLKILCAVLTTVGVMLLR